MNSTLFNVAMVTAPNLGINGFTHKDRIQALLGNSGKNNSQRFCIVTILLIERLLSCWKWATQ